MNDTHCHILPGVDDGAETMDDAVAMARLAEEEGIRTIVSTPHFNSQFMNTGPDILKRVHALNQELNRQHIDVHVLPGQETRIYGELLQGLQNGDVLTVGNNTEYVLVEFPSDSVPSYASQLFYEIQMAQYTPVIVHPERNSELRRDPAILYEFAKRGAILQVTAPSVIGAYGSKIQKFVYEMIEADLVHLIASDCHNTSKRSFHMKEAHRMIEQKYGTNVAEVLFDNAERLTQNAVLNMAPPNHIKRGFLTGLFGK